MRRITCSLYHNYCTGCRQNSTVRTHTPPQRSSAFTGFASQNTSPSDWQLGLLLINPSTAPLRPIADDIQMTAAVFYLTSSVRSARSSLYSRQAGVSGFWCHRLERPASPRRICAVTRSFQDLSVFPFLPRHYHMTYVNAITIYHYCLDTCRPCNN